MGEKKLRTAKNGIGASGVAAVEGDCVGWDGARSDFGGEGYVTGWFMVEGGLGGDCVALAVGGGWGLTWRRDGVMQTSGLERREARRWKALAWALRRLVVMGFSWDGIDGFGEAEFGFAVVVGAGGEGGVGDAEEGVSVEGVGVEAGGEVFLDG